jgi:hypothetical protein
MGNKAIGQQENVTTGRAVIQQKSVTVKHNGKISFIVTLFDDCETVSLPSEVQFNNELELLGWVVKQIRTDSVGRWPGQTHDRFDTQIAAEILEPVVYEEKGIEIDGVWYDSDEVASIFWDPNNFPEK